jgi:hypothetical protein
LIHIPFLQFNRLNINSKFAKEKYEQQKTLKENKQPEPNLGWRNIGASFALSSLLTREVKNSHGIIPT